MSTRINSIMRLSACGLMTIMLSATAAFAQGTETAKGVFVWKTLPGKLGCEKPSQLYSVTHGTINNFAGGDPLPTPNLNNFTAVGLNPTTNTFDQTGNDYHFGDTLPIAVPPGSTITAMRLTTRLKPTDAKCGSGGGPSGGNNATGRTTGGTSTSGSLSCGASNDAINFHAGNVPGPFTGFGMASISTNGDWGQPDPAAIFTFDLMTAPPGLFSSITAGVGLDVYIQDDTSVDFLTLEVCYVPPKPIDLVAHKTRTKNIYSLGVTNAGGPLPAGSVVQVVDYVPQGLHVNVPSGSGPWACSPSGSITGPDAVTCTMTVGAGGIASGAALPAIPIPFTGEPSKCPNCMRVRLQSTPVEGLTETNTTNNVSCAQ